MKILFVFLIITMKEEGPIVEKGVGDKRSRGSDEVLDILAAAYAYFFASVNKLRPTYILHFLLLLHISFSLMACFKNGDFVNSHVSSSSQVQSCKRRGSGRARTVVKIEEGDYTERTNHDSGVV
ncbi:hypothetical protein S245_019534 [Arachis hypogaea]|nr:uncharacterized protein DS421_6g173960 [Arachis hypogaea]